MRVVDHRVDAVHQQQHRGCRHAIRSKWPETGESSRVIEGELFAIAHSA
jgi:hypothetical protein